MDNTNDRVQLKQEEVVGSEVVLKDINPKTSSKSVDDSSTGVPLDKTIERIWNAINNKLSRIVNSVNGRTGVVVLNSEDVGLGNVDNVSFADIKNWIINKLILEFGNKRIRLYDDMAGLAQDIALNDESIRDSAFYCDHQDEKERRACIGYIYWDEGESRLSYMAKYINTIGSTDNSIIYNEKLGTIENGDVRDYTGGKIGVNIYKGEEALELYDGGNKNESGLRINQSKLGGKLVFFDGVYGNGSTEDDTALLYFDSSKTPSDAKRVNIYIDDVSIGSYTIRRTDLNEGDIIQCNFAGDKYIQDDGYSIPSGMAPLLMYRQPAIGRVTQAPSLKNPNQMYIIEFHTVRPNLGWGLEYLSNHKVQNVVGTPTKSSPSELTMKLTQGTTDGSGNNIGNVSGLQVYKGDSDPDVNAVGSSNKLKDAARYTVLPQGPVKVYDSTNTEFAGGLSITPDMSLCVMPVRRYSSSTSIVQSCNWKLKSPMDLSEIRDMGVSSGTLMDMSLLGINLMKVVDNATPLKFSNASGLRISSPIDNDNVSAEWFGLTDTEYNKYLESIGSPSTVKNSGGLSVNVGKFLEISPSSFTEDGDYYDGGKVNVRISKGLIEDPHTSNRIQVNIGEALKFTGDNNRIDVSYGRGLLLNENEQLEVDIGKGLTFRNNQIDILTEEGLDINTDNRLYVVLGKTKETVKSHTGHPFNKEFREISAGLKFDSSLGVSVKVSEDGSSYNKKGLRIYPDTSYDENTIYGYLYNGSFYTTSDHTTIISGESGKIYIDLTSGIQTSYKYENSSKSYVKTLTSGILGVNYSQYSGGLGLGYGGELYVRTGMGLGYTPNIEKYETNRSYMDGSIVYVNDIEDNKGVYIVTLAPDIKNYVRGYYTDGEFYTTDYQRITTGDDETMYINITDNTHYMWNGAEFVLYDPDKESYKWYTANSSSFDIQHKLLRKYLVHGYYYNNEFYSDSNHKNKINPTDDLYNEFTIFADIPTSYGYHYNKSKYEPDFEAITSDEYYREIADEGGSIQLKLAEVGCLSFMKGASVAGCTKGSLMLMHGDGLTISDKKLNIKMRDASPGLTIDSDGLGIKLNSLNGVTLGLSLNASGLGLAITSDYFKIDSSTGKLTVQNPDNWKTFLGNIPYDSKYFKIDSSGKLTLNDSTTAKQAWKDYLGISST